MNKQGLFVYLLLSICFALPLIAVGQTPKTSMNAPQDFHSYANPADVRVTHVDLDLEVLFQEKMLKGTAVLSLERVSCKQTGAFNSRHEGFTHRES